MRRREHKKEILNALTEAQKIAFSPLTFQALAAALELGVLKEIDLAATSASDLMKKLNLSEYTVSTLLEVLETVGIINFKDGLYSITSLGQTFLYDEMTGVNFEFVRDICYRGAASLMESFKTGEPKGLKELYPKAETIYPYISKLPKQMKKSWFEFDHYYSDNCFDIIYKIITPATKIFDIGANTGKFERVCLKYDKNLDLTLIDLPENIEMIKNDPDLFGCKFYATNILDKEDNLPQISGVVLMSQFLDCFSKEQIKFILQRVAKSSSDDTKIYILEPFIDRQKFAGAKLSLVHTSLYFACMANGCSKMYSFKDMEACISESGLKINAVYDALGAHDYTLLECVKNG